MAKRRKKRRSHRTGSIITTRKLNGLGNLKSPGSLTGAVVPPLLGGAVAGGTMLAMENMSASVSGLGRGTHLMGTGNWMYDYAPLIGLGATALVSGALWMFAGTPQALSSMAAGSALVGTTYVKKYLETPSTSGLRGRRGMGAIVAEQLQGLPARGTGAIVMEPNSQQGYNKYSGGEKVALSGMGSINASAFGTSAFET